MFFSQYVQVEKHYHSDFNTAPYRYHARLAEKRSTLPSFGLEFIQGRFRGQKLPVPRSVWMLWMRNMLWISSASIPSSTSTSTYSSTSPKAHLNKGVESLFIDVTIPKPAPTLKVPQIFVLPIPRLGSCEASEYHMVKFRRQDDKVK